MSAPTKRVAREPLRQRLTAVLEPHVLPYVIRDIVSIIVREVYADAAPDADAGRVAELERENASLKRELLVAERRIERALEVKHRGRSNPVAALREMRAILSGDADA